MLVCNHYVPMYGVHVHFASKHLSGVSAVVSQDTYVLLTAHSTLFTVPSTVSSVGRYITMSPAGSLIQLHYCYHNHAPIYESVKFILPIFHLITFSNTTSFV